MHSLVICAQLRELRANVQALARSSGSTLFGFYLQGSKILIRLSFKMKLSCIISLYKKVFTFYFSYIVVVYFLLLFTLNSPFV